MKEILEKILTELVTIRTLLESNSHAHVASQPNPHMILNNIADSIRKENPKVAGIFDAMTRGLGGNSGH